MPVTLRWLAITSYLLLLQSFNWPNYYEWCVENISDESDDSCSKFCSFNIDRRLCGIDLGLLTFTLLLGISSLAMFRSLLALLGGPVGLGSRTIIINKWRTGIRDKAGSKKPNLLHVTEKIIPFFFHLLLWKSCWLRRVRLPSWLLELNWLWGLREDGGWGLLLDLRCWRKSGCNIGPLSRGSGGLEVNLLDRGVRIERLFGCLGSELPVRARGKLYWGKLLVRRRGLYRIVLGRLLRGHVGTRHRIRLILRLINLKV